MFDEELLDGGAEEVDGLADLAGGVDEVGVHVVGEDVAGAHTHGGLAALGDLAEDNAKVGDGVLDGRLQLAEVAT